MIGNLPGIPIDSTGGVPVNLQDQTTRAIIGYFNRVTNSTTLSIDATKNGLTITVADTTGFIAGAYIIIFDPASLNFSFYRQIGAPAGNVITLDTPVDFNYPSGANVDAATTKLNADGSTPVTFGLRGLGIIPGVDLTIDVTKINFSCITSSAVDLAKFGNLTALTKGLVLRSRNGTLKNIFNVKSNGEIRSVFGNFDGYVKANPAQNVDGFGASFTLAGQNNVGVVLRIPMGEDVELIVQDNLSTLTDFYAIAEGHIVQN